MRYHVRVEIADNVFGTIREFSSFEKAKIYAEKYDDVISGEKITKHHHIEILDTKTGKRYFRCYC